MTSIPRYAGVLAFDADGIETLKHELLPEASGRDLEIIAPRLGHFRVELAGDRQNITGCIVVDGENRRMTITRRSAGVSSSFSFVRLVNGKSEVLGVSELARTLVFRDRDGVEVVRVPIRILPGEVVTVTY